MAIIKSCEQFENAVIDCADLTITEYKEDCADTFDILKVLKRWDGIPNITVTIEWRGEKRRDDESSV